MRLHNKVALVTGGGAGIGEAIAHKFAREGAAVFIGDVPGSAAQEICDTIVEHGGRAACFFGDLSDERNAIDCIKAAVSHFGQLDILASNAGIFPFIGDVDTWDIATFDHLVKTNCRSTFLMTKYALPHLKKVRGNIVYTGSITGLLGAAQIAPYSATKGFIHSLMESVAVEQAKYGVRANVAAPGAIATAMANAKGGGPADDKVQKETENGAAMGRQGTPEELANVVAFLASDEASYVTGSTFVADGGVVVAQGSPGLLVPELLRTLPETTLPLKHSLSGAGKRK